MARLTTDEYVATMVDTLTRREGDDVTFEVMDKLDPTQLPSRVILVEPCSCNLTPERTDVPYCTCGAAERASALTVDLRRQYATQLDLTGAVRTVQR